ncbi:Uncharacterised protein [uncultured archaeon]|nr:Uncharacterised protein [uncultured archaeon]
MGYSHRNEAERLLETLKQRQLNLNGMLLAMSYNILSKILAVAKHRVSKLRIHINITQRRPKSTLPNDRKMLAHTRMIRPENHERRRKTNLTINFSCTTTRINITCMRHHHRQSIQRYALRRRLNPTQKISKQTHIPRIKTPRHNRRPNILLHVILMAKVK